MPISQSILIIIGIIVVSIISYLFWITKLLLIRYKRWKNKKDYEEKLYYK